jgi:hypothetical protein
MAQGEGLRREGSGVIRKTAFALLLVAAAPVFAQAPPPAPAQLAQADPARLALARAIVIRIAPDGIYRRMMQGPMDQMVGGMANQMLNAPIKQFLSATDIPADQIARLNNVSARDIMAIVDPAFDQRMRIGMSTMMATMVDVLTKFEPQLREGMAQAYARMFTLEQLGEIDRFFRTPTGTAYASQAMTLMNDPSVKSSMEGLMPAIMQAVPTAMQKVKSATADLPKAKTIDELTDADRGRLAKLLGVDPAELKKAKSQ